MLQYHSGFIVYFPADDLMVEADAEEAELLRRRHRPATQCDPIVVLACRNQAPSSVPGFRLRRPAAASLRRPSQRQLA